MTLIQKITISRPFSQAAAYNQAFSFILLLSDGRLRESRKPSNKTILFLHPQNNVFLTFLMTFHFHLLLYYIFYFSFFSFSLLHSYEYKYYILPSEILRRVLW
jgi:hypothetical protein